MTSAEIAADHDQQAPQGAVFFTREIDRELVKLGISPAIFFKRVQNLPISYSWLLNQLSELDDQPNWFMTWLTRDNLH